MSSKLPRPTPAFLAASWGALLIGTVSYFFGLFNASIGLGEKGYYVILMLYGLFSTVSLQKTVRDKEQGLPVTQAYHLAAWIAAGSALALMAIGLFNATFTLAEKGFYGMAFTLSLFAAVTVQKNVRDVQLLDQIEASTNRKPWATTLGEHPDESTPTKPNEPRSVFGKKD